MSSFEAEFVDRNYLRLTRRVTSVMPIADVLLRKKTINSETHSEIRAEKTRAGRIRKLFEALEAGGARGKIDFYYALRDEEPAVFKDLGFSWKHESPSVTPSSRPKSLRDMIRQYKASVTDECKFLAEYNPSPHEPVEVSARYTEPVIIQRSKNQNKIYGHKRVRSADASSQPLTNDKNHSIKIEELFTPDSDGNTPKSVIVRGESGTGKSFMLQKLMLDWASGELYSENFDVVFLLKFDHLKCVSDELSLNELLSLSCSLTPDQISQILELTPEKVLILIDGVDESVFDPFTYLRLRTTYTLRKLLEGDLLPESFILVTTKSRAADEVMNLLKGPLRFTEIVGFSERGVQEYFQKFFQDEQIFRKTFETVKRNETLLSFCSVPLLCWMVCCCLKKNFRDDEDQMTELKTITSIYVHFLSTLLEDCDQKESLLRNLCELAEEGMKNHQVFFDEKSLAITGTDFETCVLLRKENLKEKHKQKSQFRFMHFSFQEFFSALFHLSQQPIERHIDMLQLSDYRRASDSVMFLYGLSNAKLRHSLYEKSMVIERAWIYLREEIEEMIFRFKYEDKLFALRCLYELQDEEFTRRVLFHWKPDDLSNVPLKSTDCWVLRYCLQLSLRMRHLNLMHCELTAEKLRILQPALHTCGSLRLSVEHLSEVGDLIQNLSEAKNLRRHFRLIVEEDERKDESPRWSIDLSVKPEETLFRVCLSSSEENPSFPGVSEISFSCPPSQISSADWKLFSQRLSKTEKLADDPSALENVGFLLSSFPSVGLDLKVVSLNESWASGIISLIQTCTSLQLLSVTVTGLLLEEGLKLLNESLTDPHCTVSIIGRKCSNSTDQCREQDWSHSCNEIVAIHFKPKEKCSKLTDQSAEADWSHSCEDEMEGLYTPEELEQLKELNSFATEGSGLNVSAAEGSGLNPHSLPVCRLCVHIADSGPWVQVEPAVCGDEGGSEFRISTPAGRFQCSRTTMRWVCTGDVTLQYGAVDGGFLSEDLERLQYERIGPVIDVTVISGKLEEAHLPHYVCLAESDPSLTDAVKILSVEDGGISIKSVELTRFHAKILKPSFSPTAVVKKKDVLVEQHLDLLIFMTHEDPLILSVHFFPKSDEFLKERIRQRKKETNPYAREIEQPWPNEPFQMNTPHILSVSDAEVVPEEGISFSCDVYPNFFMIRRRNVGDVRMNLIRKHDHMCVWSTTIFQSNLIKQQIVKRALKRKQENAALFRDHWPKLIRRATNVLPVADELCQQNIISREQYSTIREIPTSQERMREICSIVQSSSDQAAKFIFILQQNDPSALEDLEES